LSTQIKISQLELNQITHEKEINILNTKKYIFGANIFSHCFGVVEFSNKKRVLSIEEKPAVPKSNFAITGLYFYDNNVVQIAKAVTPSQRRELEISTINQAYLERADLKVEVLGRGFAWMDAGTPESLLEASNFVEAIQRRQGFMIACLEEDAWRNGWLSDQKIKDASQKLPESPYALYLAGLLR